MVMASKKPTIGIVGHGFVGRAYADNFERRGFSVVRYSLEVPHVHNKHRIQETDIVFICVPTPTSPKGFDASIVEESLTLASNNAIVVIKSTLIPGMTRLLQKKFPKLVILFSPEFLNASTAAKDAAAPFANIIGLPAQGAKHQRAAKIVHGILPKAPFSHTSSSEEAEVYKYAHNVSGYMQVLTYNLMYDMASHLGADWTMIQKALEADPMVSNWYIRPVHKSGRGAGGLCFIKDFAAFARLYEATVARPEGVELLRAAEKKNIALLSESKKDLHLLHGVYGLKAVRSLKKAKRGKKR